MPRADPTGGRPHCDPCPVTAAADAGAVHPCVAPANRQSRSLTRRYQILREPSESAYLISPTVTRMHRLCSAGRAGSRSRHSQSRYLGPGSAESGLSSSAARHAAVGLAPDSARTRRRVRHGTIMTSCHGTQCYCPGKVVSELPRRGIGVFQVSGSLAATIPPAPPTMAPRSGVYVSESLLTDSGIRVTGTKAWQVRHPGRRRPGGFQVQRLGF